MSRPEKSLIHSKLTDVLVENILQFEDKLIRTLIFLEIILRAKKDFKKFIESIFGQTWELRILKSLLIHGPMNKSQLSLVFFGTKRKYYVLARKGPLYYALNRLVKNGILLREGNYYAVAPSYKVILNALFC